MNPSVTIVATILFWIFAVSAICLPPRYGIVALIILVQFDLTGVALYADSSLGWENGLKTVIIPTILLLRMRPLDRLPAAFSKIRNVWVFFVAYAAVSIAWSPYRLSGVKMMGYLYAYSVLFVIFTNAWRRGWITCKALITVIVASLTFATIQTYLLGNAFGDPDYDNRFTTFSGAQSFAPFLMCMIILLCLGVKRTMSGWIAAGAAAIALVLSGSRSYFAGFAWVCLIVGIALSKRLRHKLSLGLILKSAAVGSIVIALLILFISEALPKSRMNELFEDVTARNASVQDVTTFAWRLALWARAVEEISNRSPVGVLTGSGTSSGANVGVAVGYFQQSNVDPNRVIHDEFLRVLYEWGAIGFCSFVCFLALMVRLSYKLIRLTQSPQAWGALALAAPLLLGLLIENILADGASPGGMSYCLVFSAMVAQLRPATAKVKQAVHGVAIRPAGAVG